MKVVNIYKQKNNVHNICRVYAVTFVEEFLKELNKRIRSNFKIKEKQEAETIKGMINNPTSKFETLWELYHKNEEWQQVDYKVSNLGKGAVFYFVCSRCGRLVRHLYQISIWESLRCRHCLNLGYYNSKDTHDQNPKKTRNTMKDIHQHIELNSK